MRPAYDAQMLTTPEVLPEDPIETDAVRTPRPERDYAYAALALLSVAAGFLHAAVIDAHRGHGISAQTFAGIAIFQVVWAALIMARPNRGLLAVGAGGNLVVAVGYLFSRTTGIGFVDGFQDVEPVKFTDATTTGLEVLLVLGALALLVAPARRWSTGRHLGAPALGVLGLAVALVAVPATAQAGDFHEHGQTVSAGGATDGHSHAQGAADHADGGADYAKSYKNATPEQRAAADKLLADTRAGLWQWTDPAKVRAAGFRSIGDGVTGIEHLVNWGWINDNTVLDPNQPESLVFRVTPQGRVLEAAMYILPQSTKDAEIPDVGGTITQWHVHGDLCFSGERIVDGAPQRNVVGITDVGGPCSFGENLPTAPMLHVWVVDHPCGPFSALEGVGGGQAVNEPVDPGEDPSCQHSH
jgi:hypothetical protein